MALNAIDLFCGAGGSSCGAELAGAKLVAAFDRWDLARRVYSDNFPHVPVHAGELGDLDPSAIAKGVENVSLLIASPECTNHSVARGRRRKNEASRASAFQVTRFAEAMSPRWIVIENVVSMRNWRHYSRFLRELRDLGYNVSEQVLNSAQFGVPQRRRRLFVLCDSEKVPPIIDPPRRRPRPAKDAIDGNGTYEFRPLFGAGRAKPTLNRAMRAIRTLGEGRPFLIVYYTSDHAGGWQRLSSPLRTITTVDRFALVRSRGGDYEMRMLQVPELKAAMGFPTSFRFEHGSRRDKIKLIGNAVCAPVMEAIVRKLTAD